MKEILSSSIDSSLRQSALGVEFERMSEIGVGVEVRRHTSAAPWSYAHLDARQRSLAKTIQKGATGRLLLSEVSSVITQGPRTPPETLHVDSETLSSMGISSYSTDRGGFATYHGPGQWLLFPVERLEVLTGDRRGIRKAIETLLEIALNVGKIYDSEAHIRRGCELGVWTAHGKFAAVGIHVENGVLLHGVSVNGYRTPLSFYGFKPCGLDAPVAFLLKDESDAQFQLLGDQLLREAILTLRGPSVGNLLNQ